MMKRKAKIFEIKSGFSRKGNTKVLPSGKYVFSAKKIAFSFITLRAAALLASFSHFLGFRKRYVPRYAPLTQPQKSSKILAKISRRIDSSFP